MQPLIGIATDYEAVNTARTPAILKLNSNYVDAIVAAGGLPVLIPPQADRQAVLAQMDGLLLPGGRDIDGKHLGEETHPAATVMPEERYRADMSLLEAAPPDLPVLGICLGCQLINVWRGGGICQHVPDAVGHNDHAGGAFHTYCVRPESQLSEIVGETARGQSWHHQAVSRLGDNLRLSAEAEDGTPEAIEATDRPWLIGVQWHPERTLQEPASQRLFQAFVEAAAQYARRNRS
jgi:putative glutamine amidotransferase